jgi:predicted lipoprotein with Yx(FWY)xxD motif
MKRTLLVLACAGLLAPAALAAHHEVTPVKIVTAAKVGTIVANTHGLALYTWSREQDGKVRCTGACAKQWHPLLVMKGDMVAKHVKGVMGTLGTVMRPDGHEQVTLDRHPLYTFSGDMKMEALGNGVAGWSVVKA